MSTSTFLGTTGVRVSPIALGTGRLGKAADGSTDREETARTLRAYAEAGGNFIDTSSAYHQGRAEEVIGSVLPELGRERFVVASKYGVPSRGNHRKAMQAEVEASLRRLRTDRIDLYFAHFDDGITPIDEIMRGFDDLARAGKILYVGLSNFPAWRCASAAMLADLRGWAPLVALQVQYNLLERDADRELLPFARARSLAVMAYSPLAAGVLGRPHAESTGVLAVVAAIAAELQCAPASVALAWLIANGHLPVAGPRSAGQLAANLAALDVTLTSAHRTRLDAASAITLGYPHDLLAHTRASMGLQ